LGSIIIKNLNDIYPFLGKDFEFPLELNNVKNLHDKINVEMQELISFVQFGLNNKLFKILEEGVSSSDTSTELFRGLPVFINLLNKMIQMQNIIFQKILRKNLIRKLQKKEK